MLIANLFSGSTYLIPVVLGLSAAYILTWQLSRHKNISSDFHRKLWNSILLVFGLATIVLGMLLVIRLEGAWVFRLPFNLIFWHVEAGIGLSVVSIFHILWHWKYYAKLFSSLPPK
jgi:hypothetical protein